MNISRFSLPCMQGPWHRPGHRRLARWNRLWQDCQHAFDDPWFSRLQDCFSARVLHPSWVRSGEAFGQDDGPGDGLQFGDGTTAPETGRAIAEGSAPIRATLFLQMYFCRAFRTSSAAPGCARTDGVNASCGHALTCRLNAVGADHRATAFSCRIFPTALWPSRGETWTGCHGTMR